MPRTTVAAVLATLLILAPAASAMPIDPVSEAQPKVMPERITDHPAPTGGEITQALVREHESTSGSGNQGPAMASSPSPAPAPADGDAPWLVVALLIAAAALGAAALTVVVRRNRPRVAA